MALAGLSTTAAPDLDSSRRGTIGLGSYLFVCAQLLLLLLLFRQFQIESGAFLRLSLLAFGGFAVHAFLPLPLRLPFFATLSVIAIVLVMGTSNAIWLVAIGSLLIGVCHLPIAFRIRMATLIVLGLLLVAQRASWLPAPWSGAIWPILGSMFMFRLLTYVYDLRHESSAGTWSQRLSYFFMLPNACFPLFPVVDYKIFRSNYYDDDAACIYQTGVDWMFRGVVHLLLYRYIYYHLTLSPSEVTGPDQLIQYLVSNFLLYLRVSGLFHLVIGMLHLFGFRLPETHNRYLLAASFTDFWRRINIYWKDFMQKLFYYPMFFRLRKLGATKALVIATIYVFLMTWFLHAYQWFWLRGTMLFVPQDILFWAILGVLVVFNSLYEIKYGRKRSLRAPEHNWRSLLAKVGKTYLVFWLIVILWSFWTSESLADWFSLWAALEGPYSLNVLLIPALVLAAIVVGSIPRESTLRNQRGTASPRGVFKGQAGMLAALIALILVGVEGVATRLGPEVATFVHTLRSGQLSRLDTAKLERGYYENLLSVDRFNSQLWEVYSRKPANWLDVEGANLKRFVSGFQRSELIPSFVSNTKYGTVSTNRFGMRDQDYPDLPAAGTYRAILLGASSVMGWGVSDGQTFESLVEARLNQEASDRSFKRYELLNMAVPGYDPPQQLLMLEKGLALRPNAVYYVATGRELSRTARNLVTATRDGIDPPSEPLREILRAAGVTRQVDEATAMRSLTPYYGEILAHIYGEIVRQSRSHGAKPVWVFLPQVREGAWGEETPETLTIAERSGFVLISMQDVYRGHDVNTIRLAEWDDHPNVRGHELIARRLFKELTDRTAEVFGDARQ